VRALPPALRLLAAATAALALGCGGLPATSLVLVTFDTLRADHLGAYGHALPTSPHVDALAARGVLFERAYAPMAQTLPSHATLLTGLEPREHGALHNTYVLGRGALTLAEALAARGHATAAVVGSLVLSRETGIARGFAHFDQPDPRRGPARAADRVTDAALAWADGHAGGPFLLWVHYWDPHAPYEPPPHALAAIPADAVRALVEARAERLGGPGPELARAARIRRAYDGEIRFADEELGRLLRGLEERGLLAHAAVAVTSDHGEGLREHGVWGHGVQLFEEAVRVPLIVVAPDGAHAGRRVREPVALRDVAPSLWRLVTGEAPAALPGVDRWAALADARDAAPEAVFLERPHYDPAQLAARQSAAPDFRVAWGVYAGVVDDAHKLLREPDGSLALYDLRDDPAELRDRSGERPDTAARLRRKLEGWLEAHPAPLPGMGPELPADRRAWLERLGYLVGEEE